MDSKVSQPAKKNINNKKMIKKRLAAVLLVVVILLLLAFQSTADMKEKRLIFTCGLIFGEEIYQSISAHGIKVQRGDTMTGLVRRLFVLNNTLKRIYTIDNDTMEFIFSWSSKVERSRTLVYQVQDHISFSHVYLPAGDNWNCVEESENCLLFLGGAGGRGYVKIERIVPCWFSIDTYYPT